MSWLQPENALQLKSIVPISFLKNKFTAEVYQIILKSISALSNFWDKLLFSTDSEFNNDPVFKKTAPIRRLITNLKKKC